MELRSGQRIHTYLGLLVAIVDPFPGMERLALLMVHWYGEVQVLHSFLSVLVVPYSTERRLLEFRVELSLEGISPIAEIPVASISVQRAIRTVSREDHVVHI